MLVSATATLSISYPFISSVRFADDQSEEIRNGRLRRPSPVSDPFHGHGRHGTEPGSKGGQDSCTGGREEFSLHTCRIDRFSLDQLSSGGRRNGQCSVGALDSAGSHMEGRTIDPFQSKGCKTGHGPHHVYNRVHGANFVEVDVIDRRLMDLGLGLGKPVEYTDATVLTAWLSSLVSILFSMSCRCL